MGEVEKEMCHKGKVEREVCSIREGKALWRYSSSWELDSKGKMEVLHKVTPYVFLFHIISSFAWNTEKVITPKQGVGESSDWIRS